MNKLILTVIVIGFIFGCNQNKAKIVDELTYAKPQLNDKTAAYLYHFAFECIDQEYPLIN